MAKKSSIETIVENEEQPVNTLKSLKDRLAKAAKGVHVSIMSESDLADRNDWVETPGYDLNRILSGDLRKGLPRKSLVALVAPEASGKSSLMALIAAEARKKFNSTIIVIDTEGGWEKGFITRWGLNPEEVIYVYTPWIDDIKTVLANLIDGPEKNFIILLDSVGGIEKKKIQEDALKGDPKADQGTLQKELKPLYKMLANICKTKDSIGILSAHFYGNPSGYGSPEAVGGGKYLKLAVDVVISFKKDKLYASTTDKTVIGNSLSVTTLKNRFYIPFNTCSFEIDFQKGVNKYAGILDLALECGIIEKSGNTYTFTNKAGQEFRYVGERNAQKIIEQNGEELIDELNEIVKKTGFSTLNEALKVEFETNESPIIKTNEIEETLENIE